MTKPVIITADDGAKIVRANEPGEYWSWCRVDDVTMERVQVQ